MGSSDTIDGASSSSIVAFGWGDIIGLGMNRIRGATLPRFLHALLARSAGKAGFFKPLSQLADAARDVGDFARAASLYRGALAQEPWRTDLKLQLGNMLKDAGRSADAQRAYEDALKDDPGAPDPHLQLGHVHKLSGRRAAAIASYRRALALDPSSFSALHELASQGESAELLTLFQGRMRSGGIDALLSLSSKLDVISRQLSDFRSKLPDVLSQAAFPMEVYSEFRRIFDCPPPEVPAPLVEVSIYLHADKEDFEDLHAQLTALKDQSHGTWRLYVLGCNAERREIVERSAARDNRINWVEAPPEGLARAEFRLACGQPCGLALLLAPGARLHRFALAWIAAAAERTGAAAVVMDEEIAEGDGAEGDLRVVLRQTVDAASLIGANIYGETLAVTPAALQAISAPAELPSIPFLRSLLLLNLVGAQRVTHIPLPLVRRRARPRDDEQTSADAHRQAVLARVGHRTDIRIEPAPWSRDVLNVTKAPSQPHASLQVIVPTKGNHADVAQFVTSLLKRATRPNDLKFLIVNNGARGSIDSLKRDLHSPLEIMDVSEPFNWSRFNNLAAQQSVSDYLLFANDDMEMLTDGWDQILRSFLEEEAVGVVGARLLYPDQTLQHGGILFDWQGSVVHDGLHRPASEAGPGLRWHLNRSVSAVTGAFLATRRADFEIVGGFDEVHLAVSYGDVDYALKQRARGLKTIWTPALTLFHHESKTRGLDHLSQAKAARDDAERKVMQGRWPNVLEEEPSLNPFWVQAILPHRLLNFPSCNRIWRYIERSAMPNPWLVPAPKQNGETNY